MSEKYNRTESYINYTTNIDMYENINKGNIYERNHLNSIPSHKFSNVVDIESDLKGYTRHLTKCVHRQIKPNQSCYHCIHNKKCSSSCTKTETTKEQKNIYPAKRLF